MIARITLCATALLLSPPTDGNSQAPAVDRPSATVQSQPVVVTKEEKVVKAAKSDLLTIERNIINLTNAERRRRGLPALKLDESLMKTSRHHASWMASKRRMVHSRQNLGENIAMGQPTSTSAVRAWMNSKGHRANILNRGYKKIGAAAYRTPSGTIYWCQQFRF